VDIDEMAVAPGPPESSLPLAFTDPAAKPAPQVSGVVVAAKPDAVTKAVTSHETAVTTPQQASPGEEKAVLAVVQAWAGAWSHKKVGAYLAFYSRDFRAPNSQSRSEWAKLRHERIERPKSIRVTVDMPKVAVVDATHATVSFRQGYRSDDLQTSTRKTLLMVKQGGEWLIQEERVGG
jgi:ketosteroid isomerase-like protein